MLPLGTRPVVSFSIDEAARAGCDPILVICSPSDRALHQYLLASNRDAEVRRVMQPRPRGLAEALLRGYQRLEEPRQVAVLLPDNVVLEGNPTRQLLAAELPEDTLRFGVIEVQTDRARWFGNSGGYRSEPAPHFGEGIVKIVRLQAKGEGHFNLRGKFSRPRTVGRSLIPREFFRRAEAASPNPDTGEIDDVPIYRQMIESSFALGVPLDTELHDMGTPRRYLHLCHRYFEMASREGETS